MTHTSGSIGGPSLGMLTRMGLASGLPLGAVIGDNITAGNYNNSNQNTPSPSSNWLLGADGFMTWALTLSDQRVKMPTTNVWSFPGDETGKILSELPSFLAQMDTRPGFMVIEVGTNNIQHATATGTFEAITSDWQAIAEYLTARGIRVIFVPILPRIGGPGYFTDTALSAEKYETIDCCNRWLSAFAARTGGVVAVASSCLAPMSDPAAAGAQPRAGITHDGTHPAVAGAYQIGKAISAIINTWYPPVDLLPVSSLTWESGLTDVNYIKNPMLLETYGNVSDPSSGTISGTAPNGTRADMSDTEGMTVANSQVVSAINGHRMHQMEFGGSYTASGVDSLYWEPWARLYHSAPSDSLSTLSDGDTVEGLVEFEIDASHNCIAFPRAEMRWKGSSNYNTSMQMPEVVGRLPSEAIRGVLRTPPHTYSSDDFPLSPGDLALACYVQLEAEDGTYNPTGAIRFGRATIQKVKL